MGEKGFQPGHTKVGGRKKGTPSRAKLRTMEVRQTFLDAKCNPILELIKVSRSKTPVPEHVLKALTELAKYFAPRLSTQSITAVTTNVNLTAAVHDILTTADEATIRALEQVSLRLDDAARRPQIIETRALPAAPEPLEGDPD